MSAWQPSSKFAFVAVALLLPFLPACTDSEQPLSDPSTSKPDKRLLGVWRREGGLSGTKYLFVGKSLDKKPDGKMTLAVMWLQDDVVCPITFELLPTVINDETYASIRSDPSLVDDGKENEPQYYLLKYAIKGDSLFVTKMNKEAAYRAVRCGHLRGKAEKLLGVKSATFTDTEQALRKYIQANKELFSGETYEYKRVK